ncbi:hypothetical protein F4801DRAFT_538868 [Xylaria longipes]|nr:hypothetical protein F4801DRAFT_538868 [Xylaria longipes]
MADASCGPSNAFKGLARHIEQDRSHQQDRVVPGSQQPAQTFRSTPLDSGSEDQIRAFQQQHHAPLPPVPNGPLLSHIGLLPSHPAHPAHPAQASPWFSPQPMQQQAAYAQSASSWVNEFAPGAGSSWVNDFQRMNFSDAHTRPLHSQLAQGPTVGRPSQANPMHLHFPGPLYSAFEPYQPPSTGLHPMQPQFGALQAGNNMHASQFMDDTSHALDAQAQAGLEQEFENAMDEWMLQNAPELDDLEASLDAAASTESTVHEATEQESEGNEEQETELSRAAQQLVDLLADNDTEKFKNSEFISLMRRIASRQLTVQGNDLVETSPPPTSTDPGKASDTPLTTSHQPVSTIST